MVLLSVALMCDLKGVMYEEPATPEGHIACWRMGEKMLVAQEGVDLDEEL